MSPFGTTRFVSLPITICGLQVRGSNAALSAAWKVTGYPTLLAVCNGDPALAERYSGELKSERIASFLVRPSRHCSGAKAGFLHAVRVQTERRHGVGLPAVLCCLVHTVCL